MADEENCTYTETIVTPANSVNVNGSGVAFNYSSQPQSYTERVKSSFGFICIGLVLFFASFPLLGWNEKR